MIRTQVQLPDDLYRSAKRIAAEREMSLADVIRRGLEQMERMYPERQSPVAPWQPPTPRRLGRFAAPDTKWREMANAG